MRNEKTECVLLSMCICICFPVVSVKSPKVRSQKMSFFCNCEHPMNSLKLLFIRMVCERRIGLIKNENPIHVLGQN